MVTMITTSKRARHKESLSKQKSAFHTQHAHSHELHGSLVQLQPVIILQQTITNHATQNIVTA